MKSPLVVGIDDMIANPEAFDSILDARSPSEFAEDRLPGASSTPVLNDAQRALVGTIYRHDSPFAARRLGAALVSRNIADIVEQRLSDKPREWRPLVYCWRGGNRSGALATVLSRIGWRTSVLDGGYRGFRRRVIADLAAWPPELRLRVVAGRTGCGKSLILTQLRKLGAQVLDLEALARHRGSVLGLLPQTSQPAQKAFESGLWQAIRSFDRSRPVFVESESRRVGQCHLPEALITAMRAAPGTRIEMKLEDRATLLLREYRHFTEQPAELFSRLERLVPLHGRRVVSAWRTLAESGRWDEFVVALLDAHYDPSYDRSTTSHYAGIEHDRALEVAGIDEVHLRAAARQLLESIEPPTHEAAQG